MGYRVAQRLGQRECVELLGTELRELYAKIRDLVSRPLTLAAATALGLVGRVGVHRIVELKAVVTLACHATTIYGVAAPGARPGRSR